MDQAIPRFAFITWLAMRNRLSTKERLVSWVIKCDSLCLLCRASIENRDHLFFKCSFAKRVWKKIKSMCCIEGLDADWQSIITWAELHWKSKSLKAYCCRLGLRENYRIRWEYIECVLSPLI